jgi:hypothetical protein
MNRIVYLSPIKFLTHEILKYENCVRDGGGKPLKYWGSLLYSNKDLGQDTCKKTWTRGNGSVDTGGTQPSVSLCLSWAREQG